jgi:hypothetical protein
MQESRPATHTAASWATKLVPAPRQRDPIMMLAPDSSDRDSVESACAVSGARPRGPRRVSLSWPFDGWSALHFSIVRIYPQSANAHLLGACSPAVSSSPTASASACNLPWYCCQSVGGWPQQPEALPFRASRSEIKTACLTRLNVA